MNTGKISSKNLKWAFWFTVLATVAVYIAIVGWSAPKISGYADGLVIFDLRPTGYGFQEAEAFLAALTDEGRMFYLSVQHRLDTLYPALLAVTTIWAFLLLLPRNGLALFAPLLPIVAMTFDYLENLAVAVMLHSGTQSLTAEIVSHASRYSVLKSGFTTASMSLLLLLVLIKVYRNWRAKRSRTLNRPGFGGDHQLK